MKTEEHGGVVIHHEPVSHDPGLSDALGAAADAVHEYADELLANAKTNLEAAIADLRTVAACAWITNGTEIAIHEAANRLDNVGETYVEQLRSLLDKSYRGST